MRRACSSAKGQAASGWRSESRLQAALDRVNAELQTSRESHFFILHSAFFLSSTARVFSCSSHFIIHNSSFILSAVGAGNADRGERISECGLILDSSDDGGRRRELLAAQGTARLLGIGGSPAGSTATPVDPVPFQPWWFSAFTASNSVRYGVIPSRLKI